MATDSHIQLLGSIQYEQQSGSSLGAPEDIRPEIQARDLLTGNVLQGGPVLGIDKDRISEPVRNGLLPEGRTTQIVGNAVGEPSLVSGDPDRPAQRTNVRFLHEHRLYKRACDYVNKHACMTGNKDACKVHPMPARKLKPVPEAKPPKKRQRMTPLVTGPDGKTANERLREAIAAKGVEYTEADLVRACNRIYGRSETDPPYVSQQVINGLLNDAADAARSSFLLGLAEALGVRALWMQQGIGPMKDERAALLDQLLDQVAKRQASKS